MDCQKQNRQQMLFFLIALFGFAALLRLMVGVGYINTFDTYWYRKWAVDLPNGLFSVYTRAESISLDYPPLYLFPLYFIGLIYKAISVSANTYIQMLLMKFFPMLFDVLCGVLIYRICRKDIGEKAALCGATAWLLNPSMFFNSTMWGQTDSIMAFLLLLSFWYLTKKRTVLACVLFAVAGLTKYQSLLFTPVFLLEYFYTCKNDLKKIFSGLGAAFLTVLIVFLPFMIGSGDPLLFFRVYTGGADTYPYCSLYSFNLFGAMGLDWSTGIKDTQCIFWIFSYQMFGYVMMIISMIMLLVMYVKGQRRSPWVAGLFFMDCVFMLTTRMHERYQVIVLPFALMAYLFTKKFQFGISFILHTVMTGLNQFMVLLFHVYGNQETPWERNFDTVLKVMSVLNVLLFVWTAYICIKYFLADDKKKQTLTEGIVEQ